LDKCDRLDPGQGRAEGRDRAASSSSLVRQFETEMRIAALAR
jgi:hypothetical protein